MGSIWIVQFKISGIFTLIALMCFPGTKIGNANGHVSYNFIPVS